MRITILLLILILISSCCDENQSILLNTESVEYYKEKTDYDYSIEKFITYDDCTRLIELEFYKDQKLVEEMWGEFHAQYFYNSRNELFKINNCRFNNCNAGSWEFIKYDENRNLIGSLRTTDSIVAMDSVVVHQNKFYDEHNRLTKELIRNSDILWKTYTYKNGVIDKEFKISEKDTLLFGEYFYNDENKLKKIERKKDSTYFREIYQYKNDKLSKKILEGNQFPLDDNVKFSANNSITEYYYNDESKLIKEIIFDHRGKQYQLIEYQIKRKKY